MSHRLSVIAIAVLLAALLTVPLTPLTASPAYAGGAACSVADPIWKAGIRRAGKRIRKYADKMVSKFAKTSAKTTSSIVSAIKVLTAQTANGS